MGIGTFGRRVPDQIIVGSIRDQEGGSAGPGRVVLSHPPLTPTFTSPRLAPIPPKPSSIRSFNSFASSIFRKQQQPRASSLRSTNSEDTLPSHPFSAMHLAPLPVVSNHDSDDEEDCPVCLEPLSFSFRLPGEKPHIVPECGHALHEVFGFFLSVTFFNYGS